MLIASHTEAVAGGRSIRLPGLPDFNAGDETFKINAFEGLFDGPTPTPVLVANGGGPGAVAVGDWEPAETYYAIAGRIDARGSNRATFRKLLLAAVPRDREVAVTILGNEVDVDLQVFGRLYDKLTCPPGESVLRFTIPLVAPDPFKYALEPLVGTVGVFIGQRWFRTYADNGGTWVRTYTDNAGTWSRTYEQSTPDGPFPTSVALDADGDATSQRVTVEVVGPLTAGDWWVENLLTGRRMWAELSVTAGQTLVFDSRAMTAHLNGADVTHLMFGDWLTLEPGANTYRLNAGVESDAHATITALPAHQ